MPDFKLFIATSLDGFIARSDGSLDWLDALPNPDKSDFGYSNFYNEIDVLVMGRETYEWVLRAGVEWPYKDRQCFVVSTNSKLKISTPNTSVLSDLEKSTIQKIEHISKKNIWIVGGGMLIRSFMDLGKIDEMLLSIIPRTLGSGIPLFPQPMKDTTWNFIKSEAFSNGVVNLTYRKNGN